VRISLIWLLLSLLAAPVLANHSETEPSDGTVNSFIAVETPQPVMPLPMIRDNTESLSLADFEGKLVLLNLWATWCPPCIRELPALDRLQQRLGSDRFEVLAVALDDAGYPAVRSFYDRLDIKHLGLYMGRIEEFARQFPVDVFPASFFIDARGRVISYMRSYADWDDPQADALIQRYLDEAEHGAPE